MKMSERPLLIDVSSHQTYLDIDKALSAGNKVLGIIMRASVGLNKDMDFPTFDEYYDWDNLYRASYHALWPIFSITTQVDNWMEADPDGAIYMEDVELHNDMAPSEVASAIISESNMVLARTGKRPWMYGAYYFLMKYLIPFATEEWLNEHWWVLASYGDGDADEDDGYSLVLPDKIHIDKVAFQQTTSKAELYPGSGNVDRDRFLLGGEAELKDFMSQYFEVAPPDDCCEELWSAFIEELDGVYVDINANATKIANINTANCQQLEERLSTLEDIITNNGGDITNCCGELRAYINELYSELYDFNLARIKDVLNLEKHVKANTSDIAELREEYDEYADVSWIQVLKNKGEIVSINETIVGTNGVYERIEELEVSLDGMAYFQRNNSNDIEDLLEYLDTHAHVEPVGGTFGQRLRWLFTGKTVSE